MKKLMNTRTHTLAAMLTAIVTRLPKELIMIPVYTVLMYAVLNSLEKVGIKRLAV